MIWDLFQQQEISQNKRNIEDAQDKVRDVSEAAMAVSERMNRIAIVSNAVWELLKERTGVTEADLLQKIEEIDKRDGLRDGKVSAVMKTCLGCGKKINSRNRSCIYCGVENRHYTPFAE